MEIMRKKVGEFILGNQNHPGKISREYFGQGYIFKDEEAFLHHPEKACYISELSDVVYTKNDLLSLCRDNVKMAEECFYSLDWQHPESWIDEQCRNDEFGYCPVCGEYYAMHGTPCCCPKCGWDPDSENGRPTRKILVEMKEMSRWQASFMVTESEYQKIAAEGTLPDHIVAAIDNFDFSKEPLDTDGDFCVKGDDEETLIDWEN